MKNQIKCVFLIIGTIIGAGFASGQEIYSFFNVYKENGILGIFISSIIIGLVIYYTLKKSNKYCINSYNKLLEKSKIPKKIVGIANIIINMFLLISFYIMVAGFTAYFNQEFNVPKILTSIVVLVLCYLTFKKNIEGMAIINCVIIPILIIIILIMGYKANALYTIYNMDMENIEVNVNWIIKSIEYAGYNCILLVPILISARRYATSNEKKISIITTSVFFLMSCIIYLVMFKFNNIANIEIPLIYIASKFGLFFKYVYGIVIIFAIYTTMISAGYGFLQNCSKNEKEYIILASIICITGLFISQFSFSGLVNLTYPIFGVLGICELLLLI